MQDFDSVSDCVRNAARLQLWLSWCTREEVSSNHAAALSFMRRVQQVGVVAPLRALMSAGCPTPPRGCHRWAAWWAPSWAVS